MKNINKSISENLKYTRIRLGWSQAFVSQLSGLSIRSISRAETGCSISKSTIKKLCNLYRIDDASLYNSTEPVKTSKADLLSDDVIAAILHRNSLLSDLQREVILQFTASVGNQAVLNQYDVESVLTEVICQKKSYSFSDVVAACLAVNQKTVHIITDIAVS
ncbi:MAG: helix-turn-helix domain-containing protein [Vampirovibrionia bacterium]|jgi:transcriptional regulator with XRE-family HTH domain